MYKGTEAAAGAKQWDAEEFSSDDNELAGLETRKQKKKKTDKTHSKRKAELDGASGVPMSMIEGVREWLAVQQENPHAPFVTSTTQTVRPAGPKCDPLEALGHHVGTGGAGSAAQAGVATQPQPPVLPLN